jgi:hypothetical protein
MTHFPTTSLSGSSDREEQSATPSAERICMSVPVGEGFLRDDVSRRRTHSTAEKWKGRPLSEALTVGETHHREYAVGACRKSKPRMQGDHAPVLL